ncbi:hypothetical protein DH09_13670 [Bacillaceae bacterium JMAK1]|nr:hypothetical protein DH09_13670 [Bacillaceae bacterium JMAK1]
MNIQLKSIDSSDYDSIFLGMSDSESLDLTGTRHTFTKEQIKEVYERFAQDSTRYDFAIYHQGQKETIGDAAIIDIDEHHSVCGFRIALHQRKDWNKGYGSEAVRLLQAYVFETLQLNRLELEVLSHNVRAIRAYEKNGFVREGARRQAVHVNGIRRDEVLMSMLKEEYELKKQGELA